MSNDSNVIQLPKYPCPFCKRNEATQLCDFVVDYGWTTAKDDNGRMMGSYTITCDNEMCKECADNIGGHEFCPSCKKLYDYVKENHERRMRHVRWFSEEDLRYE